MDKTYLILDIEQGSVGAALVRVSESERPKLFGEARVSVPLLNANHGELLAGEVQKAVREALSRAGLVASRLRNVHGRGVRVDALHRMGNIENVAVFLGAPWGVPNLEKGAPDFAPGMQEFIAGEVAAFFSGPALSYYTAAGAAHHGHSLLYPQQDALVCLVGGEILEMLLVNGGEVAGYATLPQGYRTLLRTLKTHGGLSVPEGLSALALSSERTYEPLAAAARHLGQAFAAAAGRLLAAAPVETIFVVAPEPVGAWVARALAGDKSLDALFPHGGGVRALAARHLHPHVEARAPAPDHALMLEALYINALS